MSTKRKVLFSLLGGVVFLAAVAYWFRVPLIVSGIGYAFRASNPVAEYRDISWEAAPEPAASTEERPPNIILILVDDMGFNDVSYHGGGLIPTPNIDRLANQGVRFANGYAGSSVCSPSRAMLMTGRYSTRFGFEFTPTPDAMTPILNVLSEADPMPRRIISTEVHEAHHAGHDLPFDSRGLPPEEETLAEYLQREGYHTLHIGKWHLGREQDMLPNAQGFDESLQMASGLYLPVDSPDVVNAYNELAVMDTVQWEVFNYAVSFNGSEDFAPRGYLTDYFSEEGGTRHRCQQR